LEKITQQCTHSRPKGHEPTFVKFTFANDEQLALEIDITDQQPNRLTDAQTQSVEDCEDSAVGHGSQWNTRIVRQGTRYVEQAARCDSIEDEWEPLCRSAFGFGLYRNTTEKSL